MEQRSIFVVITTVILSLSAIYHSAYQQPSHQNKNRTGWKQSFVLFSSTIPHTALPFAKTEMVAEKRSARVLKKDSQVGPRTQTLHNRGSPASPEPRPRCVTPTASKFVPALSAHTFPHAAQAFTRSLPALDLDDIISFFLTQFEHQLNSLVSTSLSFLQTK